MSYNGMESVVWWGTPDGYQDSDGVIQITSAGGDHISISCLWVWNSHATTIATIQFDGGSTDQRRIAIPPGGTTYMAVPGNHHSFEVKTAAVNCRVFATSS